MKHTKFSQGNYSIALCAAFGILVAIVTTAALLLLLTTLITKGNIGIDGLNLLTAAISVIAVFIGTFIFGIIEGRGNSLTFLLVPGCYYFLQLAVAALFFDGISSGFWTGIPCAAIGGGVAFYICSKRKTPKQRKRRKKTYR